MPVEDAAWDDPAPGPVQVPPVEVTDTVPRGPSVTTPDLDLEPHRDPVEDASDDGEEAPDDEPLPEFDPKVRQDFDGLLFLGKLEDEFYWLGHRFVIRTLVTDEILEVGLLHKQYAETLADVKAYQAAVAAACVVTVDGKPLPQPLSVDPSDTALRNRFDYVRKSWYPSVLDQVYQRYLMLEGKVDAVIEAMGNPSR